jgi:hypothetical protein
MPKYTIKNQFTAVGSEKRADLGAKHDRVGKQRGEVILSLLDEHNDSIVSWIVSISLLEEVKEDQELQDAILRFKLLSSI